MANIKNKYNSSFSILRANPRISGNVKITVDSSENLWLNSIDSNNQLSKSIYKGFKISSNSDYAQDLYKFFDNGTTPSEFVFGVRNENSQVTTYVSDYSDQYDGFYSTGANFLASDIYTEDFSYFAPFWLGRDIPSNFVVYRIDDPIDFSYINPVTSLALGKSYKVISTSTDYSVLSSGVTYTDGNIFIANSTSFTVISGIGNVVSLDPNYNINSIGDPILHFQDKILPKSSIVATYDLSENSEIGKYLRKIQNSYNYQESLLNARFEENIMTYYNGVNYSVGVYDSKGEYLYDFYTNPTTQIEFEEFITDGFQRNGIISYKYINLEFLFNDPEAPMYSINRYFGVFVDPVPTGTFRLDGNAFFTNDFLVGNTPEPKSPAYVSDTLETTFYQENPKGVRLFIDNDTKYGYIPSSDIVNSNPRLYYIQDNEGNYYSYNNLINYSANTDPSYQWGINSINENSVVLKNKVIDLSKFTGFSESSTKQINATGAGVKGNPYAVLQIGGSFLAGESIVIYHPLGSKIYNGAKCDILVASDMSTVVKDWGPGSFYNLGDGLYFHPSGTNSEIAEAIYGAINSIYYKGFISFLFDDEVVLRATGTGYNHNSSFAVDVFTDLVNGIRMNRRNVFSVNSIDSLDFRYEQFFIGGTDYFNNRLKISLNDSYKIIPGRSLIRTTRGVSVIDNIFAYVDDININALNASLDDYKTHAIITYEDYLSLPAFGYLGQILIEEIYENETGIFSICPIKDMDYDFWYSEYNVTQTEEYYRYLDLQPNGVSTIYEGQTYCVNAGCTILYDGNYYGDGASPTIYNFIGTTEKSFELISTTNGLRFNVIPLSFTKNPLNGALTGSPEPLTDLDRFTGFPGIQDIKFIDDLSSIVTKYQEMNFGKLNTEYEVLKENYQKNFVTLSRVTPFINKWVYEGGIDARGNEYRLNVHPAFTPFNFSPSFFSAGRDPRYFTHEWYLLETPRLDSPATLVSNSLNYCTDILDISKLTDCDPGKLDYFLNYFTVDGKDFYENLGKFGSSDGNPISEKYTTFEYNTSTGFSETLFRGIKVNVKSRTASSIQTSTRGEFINNDKTYDGYKFSCIIKPIDDPDPFSPTPPISYEVYENQTFKTITFIVSIVINDSRYVDGEKFWNAITSSPGVQGPSWEFNPTGIYGGIDYMSLYSLEDKLMLTPLNAVPDYGSIISDIKLSAAVNFSYSLGTLGIPPILNGSTVNGSGVIPIIRNNNYNTDLRDEISSFYSPSTPISGPGSPYNPDGSPPLTINGTNENGLYTLYSPKDEYNDWFTFPWPVGVGINTIYFNQTDITGAPGTYIPTFSTLGYTPPLFSHAPINVNYNDLTSKAVYQVSGGTRYWKILMEKISFVDIALLVNSENPYIKYYSYSWDSVNQINVVENENFVVSFSQPSAFIQDSNLYPIEDQNKPQNLTNVTVGYTIGTETSTNEYYRYGGGYNPKFRDIIPFSSFKDDKLEDDSQIISVSLVEKSVGSLYEHIGSDYEIALDGNIREILRLVRGLEYTFNYSNFTSSNASPNNSIIANLVISTLENDGISNIYSSGVTIDPSGKYITFLVPYNAPDTLYYEIGGAKYSGGSILVEDNLAYQNTKIGLDKNNFGNMKNISYNKYALSNPFTIDPNSGFLEVYPLIGESPFDIRNMSVFESTWDPGRYRKYSNSTTYQLIPGTRNMMETNNFFGTKVMKTPDSITIQQQNQYNNGISTGLVNVFSTDTELYPGYDVFWQETDTQILALLLLDQSLINYFDSNGAGNTFTRLLLPDFGTSTDNNISDDINNYLTLNVLPRYKDNGITVYIKQIPKVSGVTMPIPIITNLNDHDKIRQGFYEITQASLVQVKPLEYQFVFNTNPGYYYQIAFSYNIGKI